MSYMKTYINVSEYQNFQNITPYKDTNIKIPFGYHYDEHRWTYIYNKYTGNKIGTVIVNNNYHNIGNVVGGFCNNSYVMFIDKEYDVGTIQFILNFSTILPGTLLPLRVLQYGTFVAGTLSYYGKPFKITLLREDVILNINIDLLPSSIPPSINNSQILHFYVDEFQVFTDVSLIDQKSNKLPHGYHYKNIEWTNIHDPINNNIIGKGSLFNNYHNTNTTQKGGFCNNNTTVYIEKYYPVGSISYTMDFITPEETTNYIKGTTIYPTVTTLTGKYYGRIVKVMIVVSLELVIDIYFNITPPI